MSNKQIVLYLFIFAYVFFICFPKRKTLWGIIFSAAAIIAAGITPVTAVSFVNWNVLAIFLGMLLLTDSLMESKVPTYIAEVVSLKIKDAKWVILFICVLTSLLSSFLENVATVLIMAPIAFAISDRFKINPVNFMIAIAISSNLQGTATLIGDPPSMLLAHYAHLNFNDFFFLNGKPGIFFAVTLGAVFSFIVLYIFFRNIKGEIKFEEIPKVISWKPFGFFIGLVITLIGISFMKFNPLMFSGIACIIFGFLGAIWVKKNAETSIIKSIKKLDWETTIFLATIFMLIGAVEHMGWLDNLANLFTKLFGHTLLSMFLGTILFSVLVSGFVDNVPYIITMAPVIKRIIEMNNFPPYILLFGLLIGTCLGGNITPIGAAANIVAVGALKDKKNIHVNFWEFARIGLPFTIAAVLGGAVFLWFVWGK